MGAARAVAAKPEDSEVEGPGIDFCLSHSSFVSFLLPKLPPILRRYPYMRGPAIFLTVVQFISHLAAAAVAIRSIYRRSTYKMRGDEVRDHTMQQKSTNSTVNDSF